MQLRPPRMWIIALAAIGLGLSARPANAGYLNLTVADSSGTIATDSSGGNALFTEGPIGSGTGMFPAFVQINQNGTEAAYNTTVNNVLNNGSADNFNHALLYSDLTVVNYLGKQYFQFTLDINESNNADRFLSLDKLQIYTSNLLNPNTTDPSTLGTKVYDIGANNGVLLDFDNEPGSGYADLTVLIPVFQLQPGELYVYLYSSFGAVGTNPPAGAPSGDYGSSDGFEEWGARTGGGNMNIIPAPAGLVLFATALPVFALRRMIRRKTAA